jgi:hypothetical protein
MAKTSQTVPLAVWDDLDFAMTFRANPAEDPPVWTQISTTLELTLSAGAACVLSGFDLHWQIDALGSLQEYVK